MTPLVTRILKRLRLGRPVESPQVTLVHAQVMDKDVTFCVNMENDPIQRNHRRGGFYEMHELREIAEIFPKGGTFVDIGANVGNHSLFAALFFGAGKVIPFEPNRLAFQLLIENVLVNGLRDKFDLSKLGVGVSDAQQDGFAMEKRNRNLGAAKMLAGKGKLSVYSGDELLEGIKPAMIKIDVEGMELQVLNGLKKVIKAARPIMLVEVDNTNEEAFLAWAKTQKYAVLKTYQRYRLNKNHLLVDAKDLKKYAGFGEKTTSPEKQKELAT